MRTSDLAREGIENSGSYRFADHVYRNEPSGRFGIGRALDAMLLRMRARPVDAEPLPPRAGRDPYAARVFASRSAADPVAVTAPFRVLSIPSGIARDLVLAGQAVERELPGVYARSTFFGVDLDPAPVECSREPRGTRRPLFLHLRRRPRCVHPSPRSSTSSSPQDSENSSSDDLLVRFYKNCHDRAPSRRHVRHVLHATRPRRGLPDAPARGASYALPSRRRDHSLAARGWLPRGVRTPG